MPTWDRIVAWAEAIGVRLTVRVDLEPDTFDRLRDVLTVNEAETLYRAWVVVKKS